MSKRNITCIVCPIGCRLDIDMDDIGVVKSISGNKCNRGEGYAINEITNPTRILTTIIPVQGGIHPVIPVKTNGEIPKPLILEVMKLLENVKLNAPVKQGQVILENVFNTGIDVVASRSM